MTLTILQHDITWANPLLNCRRLETLIDAQPSSDLYVLTEMWSTGFMTQPAGVAGIAEDHALRWMKELAHHRQAAIAGSIVVEEEGHYYNRFFFVKPDGEVAAYDKRHLFSYGGEDKQYSRGEKRVIVEWKGVRFLLQVCYDLRFPVWSRNHNDYDAILYVANWPVSRIEAWSTLLRARAIENQCYVVGVNRVGKDPSCEYNGASAVIDPYGKTLVSCSMGTEDAATVEIDMTALKSFRQKFPVLSDADQFNLVD